MNTAEYIQKLNETYKIGNATEHTYRPLFKQYFESLLPDVKATNEPKRQKCGAPDFIISRTKHNAHIDIGYIEAKDIGKNLNELEKDEQLKRYKQGLENLIFTDYFDFRFFKNGEKVAEIKIAELTPNGLQPLPENYAQLEALLKNFSEFTGQTIKSAKALASMMAKKAILIKEAFSKALKENDENNSLNDQYEGLRKILIHDLTHEQFADIYAQTVTYGLFTARLHDKTLETFSRAEARELIPRSNPFLLNLFEYISGAQLDFRVIWIVDALCEVYRATNIADILQDFGKKSGRNDPIVHFYEDFLGEYNPKLRKSRGVWYTPEPVVNFIIRAIDDCLIQYFNLPDGLATTDKIKIKIDEQAFDKRTKTGKAQKEIDVHKVQLLDVATGTGTFIAEVIKQIYNKKFEHQKGMWSNYVEEHLLPRLHGFEILMASYAMCHMKVDLLLEELGYKPKDANSQKRLSVYLTNSLEEAHPDTGTLFTSWLSQEAEAANLVKKDMPVMVAFGNPPYSVSSANKGEWIQNLIKEYKKDLNERKINLDDDYIKFIRYAEHYIEKNGYGIVAMITNNSFIDGVTHRQMRKHLAETFDTIYIYDLHGDSERDKNAPDGKIDKNVFDIKQGVSISIFIKHKQGKEAKQLAEVYHYDAYGKRNDKYETLWNNSITTTAFKRLQYKKPYYFFVPKDFDKENEYFEGFMISDLLKVNSNGIETAKDDTVVKDNKETLDKVLSDFLYYSSDEIEKKYGLTKDKIGQVQKDLAYKDYIITDILYRPFDLKKIPYTTRSQGILWRPRNEVMKNMITDNIAILAMRQFSDKKFSFCLVSKNTIDNRTFYSSRGKVNAFPLYLYNLDTLTKASRQPNLNAEIVKKISEKLVLLFVPDHEDVKADGKNAFSPLDLLDYIYAVLHSPAYREKYKEFLKIDFPRIPYPEKSNFWQLVALGKQIRELHLLESPLLAKPICSYDIDGDNIVGKPEYKDGKVYINKTQYFNNVPEIAWNFYIGGYQPAIKWLKDRKARALTYDDISHYQKIIIALFETDKLMKQIDEILKA